MTAALQGGEWSTPRPDRNFPPGKSRYPFYRRLGGPQGRSGRAENLFPTGNFHLVPRSNKEYSYTSWAFMSFSRLNFTCCLSNLYPFPTSMDNTLECYIGKWFTDKFMYLFATSTTCLYTLSCPLTQTLMHSSIFIVPSGFCKLATCLSSKGGQHRRVTMNRIFFISF